ncbi:hypothetical protein [Streptomyces sp. DHE17-7]|uniref:hypothetical protein n=1 Tax=Streptomyces sp. DHE17-7 TaxID=2759949 RepID=UPI0022EA10D9|nr:hypothetical protein [Streptomyces sp. DHE17-7]
MHAHTHRLQTDPMVRAAVRLTMDQLSTEFDRTGPFRQWADLTRQRLEQARDQGELLPHVNPTETADVLVGAYAGIQSMSTPSDNDSPPRQTPSSALLRHPHIKPLDESHAVTSDLNKTGGALTSYTEIHTTNTQNRPFEGQRSRKKPERTRFERK